MVTVVALKSSTICLLVFGISTALMSISTAIRYQKGDGKIDISPFFGMLSAAALLIAAVTS